MKTEECCNHNCNQGRDCPRRNKRNLSEEITEGFKALETTRNSVELDTRSYLIGRYDAIKTGNEPVFWACGLDEDEAVSNAMKVRLDLGEFYDIPLYTHPAKTLTDEEIDSVSDEIVPHIDTYAGRREFARAILRKAQEK